MKNVSCFSFSDIFTSMFTWKGCGSTVLARDPGDPSVPTQKKASGPRPS